MGTGVARDAGGCLLFVVYYQPGLNSGLVSGPRGTAVWLLAKAMYVVACTEEVCTYEKPLAEEKKRHSLAAAAAAEAEMRCNRGTFIATRAHPWRAISICAYISACSTWCSVCGDRLHRHACGFFIFPQKGKSIRLWLDRVVAGHSSRMHAPSGREEKGRKLKRRSPGKKRHGCMLAGSGL